VDQVTNRLRPKRLIAGRIMTIDVSSQYDQPPLGTARIGGGGLRWALQICSYLALLIVLGCRPQAASVPDGAVDRGPPERTVLSLPGINTAALIDVLCHASDKDDAAKRHSAILLGMIRDTANTDCLHQVLRRERNPSVRAAAARSLGEIGAASSLPELDNALLDPHRQVRIAAIQALSEFGDKSPIKSLRRLASGEGPEALVALRALARTRQGRELLSELPHSPASRFRVPMTPVSTLDGRRWYVDASAGNDDAEGSEEAPFRTLTRAVRELRGGAGDHLLATSGYQGLVFHEEVSITPDRSGTIDRPTVVSAWPGHPRPILDGALPERPDQPGLTTGIHVGASFVRVVGFTVRHFVENGISLNGSTGNVIEDCKVERCDRHGIFAYYSPRSTIVRPEVRNCQHQGISIRSSPHTAVIDGLSEANGFDGLLLLQDSDDVLISGLRASGNKRGIAATSHSDGARLVDVLLQGNTQDDLYFDEDCPVTLVNSTIGASTAP